MQYCRHTHIFKVFMFTRNSDLIRPLSFLFAKSGDTTNPMTK